MIITIRFMWRCMNIMAFRTFTYTTSIFFMAFFWFWTVFSFTIAVFEWRCAFIIYTISSGITFIFTFTSMTNRCFRIWFLMTWFFYTVFSFAFMRRTVFTWLSCYYFTIFSLICARPRITFVCFTFRIFFTILSFTF